MLHLISPIYTTPPPPPAWTHNCVGHNNHRYFFLFLVYIWFGCFYLACMSCELFLHRRRLFFYGDTLPVHELIRLGDLSRQGYLSTLVDFAFVLSITIWLALSGLLGWQSYLISTGQSNVEFYINRENKRKAAAAHEQWSGNVYDQGWKRNWILFLGLLDGTKSWLRLLCPVTQTPVGDGIDWRLYKKPEYLNLVSSSL